LLLEGIKAKNRTEFETQMILNHKNALAFIIENKDLFGNNIRFRTIEDLHRIIGNNLGIGSGIRKQLVRITESNYEPLSNPHQLRENADNILEIINKNPSPYIKALLALALVPYLQIFEDGNKRTGRMLANAILINFINRGFSLRKTDTRSLAIAYLAFYEFNSISALSKVLQTELKN
jgi:Fic family protein